ncbi:DUF1015 family protein [Nocardioides daejeonensis]|uniref:DUF1015 family protein n=1 Tax=Nocardioides daejeonensis TaxID=1046556 RepID=UPI000D745FC6|nr:DUF1015 family protein [Nocardioides daejeonensis]
MDENAAGDAFVLTGFRALRLTDSHVGDPVAHRILSRPYRAVPARVREWRTKRRLRLDRQPALYVHEYTSHGVTVRGIVGNLELGAAAHRVHPHELVHDAQVSQLADRMEAMALNPAPILLMHRGPQAVRETLSATTAQPPHLVYTDRADQLHRIWRIEDPDEQRQLSSHLIDAHVVIADGHHRFAAAERLRERHPGTDWDQTLVMLVDQADTPLQLGAIHRSIPRLALHTVAATADRLGAVWTPRISSHQALAHLDRALVLHDGTAWGTLRPREPVDLLVRWLHEHLVPGWDVAEATIAYHHSASEAMDRAGLATAVLLPAPTFGQVETSARSGALLPQKASSFQPKPHLGVLMRQLDGAPGDQPTH